jgi:hypothetical protein
VVAVHELAPVAAVQAGAYVVELQAAMTRFTFDSTFPDGSPRRSAGMNRPAYDYHALAPRYPFFGSIYPDRVFAYWQRGGFDLPIYHVEDDE